MMRKEEIYIMMFVKQFLFTLNQTSLVWLLIDSKKKQTESFGLINYHN